MPFDKSILQQKFPHERDLQLKFEPEFHKYVIQCDSDSNYTSVTSWNHEHFPKFEANDIIDNMMKSKKTWKPGHRWWPIDKVISPTKEEIQKEWKKNGDVQSDAGTKLHDDIECFMNMPVRLKEEDGPLRHHHLLAFYKDDSNASRRIVNNSSEWQYFLEYVEAFPNLRPYRTEWMIWDEELKLAGSIDMIYENEDNETLSIYDWKRAKSIVKSKDNPLYNTYALTPCISHLVDTNFWHYSLQLNTYKAMLERKYGKRVTDLVLVRLHPENDTFELIPVANLQDEIRTLFDLRLNPPTPTPLPIPIPQKEEEIVATKPLQFFKIPKKQKKEV
jgi:hypothetical protein